MIKGIYTSAAAMRYGILRQEANANNLANANTTGYKRDRLFLHEMLAATAGTDPLLLKAATSTDFSSGPLNPTGSPFDLALQGRGFFVVSDEGTEHYTRNGHFERSAEGLLVDTLGRRVQGEGGDIALPAGTMTVSASGEISVDGTVVARLRVVDFDNPQALRKSAGSAFVATPESGTEVPVEKPVVRQGFLELSNVDTVREMVDMIAIARHYEINARLLTAQDDTLRHTVNELGRV